MIYLGHIFFINKQILRAYWYRRTNEICCTPLPDVWFSYRFNHSASYILLYISVDVIFLLPDSLAAHPPISRVCQVHLLHALHVVKVHWLKLKLPLRLQLQLVFTGIK